MMKKQDKIKALCIANLTYCRLKADLAAVELEIAGNSPVAETEESNFLKKILNKAKTALDNEIRKKTTEELQKDREAALRELTRFENQHSAKELQLAKDSVQLKKFVEKALFKKDKSGLSKVQFALSLILDNTYTYQRPAQSMQIVSDILFDDAAYMQGLYDLLCKNFKYLHNDVMPTVDELFSLAPSLGNVSLQSFINRSKQRNFKSSLEKLSADQVGTIFAVKLTLAEKAKTLLSYENWENLLDETLQFIGDIRADAEYKKVFTGQDDGVSDEVFALCSLAVNRLAELVKA